MSINNRRFKASDLVHVATADSFNDPCEPALTLGNFVRLNSGGPTMMVVDIGVAGITVSWTGPAGAVYEHSFPRACIHRVSPSSVEYPTNRSE